MDKPAQIAFLGAGGIAQAHAYALDNLKYYYMDATAIEKRVVASPTPARREAFSQRFGFQEAIAPDTIWDRDDIDTLYILGPNPTHTPQLLKAVEMPSFKHIYLEKPVGASPKDIANLEAIETYAHGKVIFTGFQFLQKSALRKALWHWRTGTFGEPIHFRAEYLHSSYLDPEYRKKHVDRLAPIPANGAVVDLGSHILSLLIAFLGEELAVIAAAASGKFDDSPGSTDLCCNVMLTEPRSGAIGTMLASRVSQGTGDRMVLEIRATKGALLYDSDRPDSYDSFHDDQGWQHHDVLSNYGSVSNYPADYTPSGWLRALVHNHYLFLGGQTDGSFIPDLRHGIQVQHLIQQIADHLQYKGGA